MSDASCSWRWPTPSPPSPSTAPTPATPSRSSCCGPCPARSASSTPTPVAAIVLTGADPAFCAGLDLREVGSGDGGPLRDSGASGGTDAEAAARRGPMPAGRTTPLIGAVNGAAVTGGLEVALACDWLVASERARFADTHARVGIQPGLGPHRSCCPRRSACAGPAR